MKKSFLIVGAGVAGLTAALQLARQGHPVTVVEKESRVGGLARSFRYDGYVFDIGPHRFYSSIPRVLSFLHETVPDGYNEIERFSAVYYYDHYHTWPLRLKSVFQMPLHVSVPAFFDIFTKSKYNRLREPSFRNFILKKYGNTLYETFFKVYTGKFLGLDPEQVHYHWAKIGVERATIDEKIKTGSIFQLFCLMMMPRPRQLDFLYPRGGCDLFCTSLEKKILAAGGTVKTGVKPASVTHDGKSISRVDLDDGTSISPGEVMWTAPVTEALHLLGHEDPNLGYLPIAIFNLMMDRPPKRSYQWCYFGSGSQVFSRVTNPATFDEANVPAGKGALCAEVTCPPSSGFWENPEKLRDRVIDGLVEAGSIASRNDVIDVQVERIPDTYPIYDINYLKKLEKVRQALRPVENLHLAGRTGLFWYNNMDHSIHNALATVERITAPGHSTREFRRDDPFHLGAPVGDPI